MHTRTCGHCAQRRSMHTGTRLYTGVVCTPLSHVHTLANLLLLSSVFFKRLCGYLRLFARSGYSLLPQADADHTSE